MATNNDDITGGTDDVIYITNTCIGSYSIPDYIIEQILKLQAVKEVKKGWHNPRKIPLRNNHIKRADNYRNRNNLTYKFRKNEINSN